MVYNLKENIKHQIDDIMDVSFLEAIKTILATKHSTTSRPKQNNYQLLIDLTAQYIAVDEPDIDVTSIYQNRIQEDERPLDFN
ncbi:MAG: hypothetical protein AAF806_10345 [Bacteroidota bacterium]